MSPFCMGHCADKTRLSHFCFFFVVFCSPDVPPPRTKWLCYPANIATEIEPTRKAFLLLPATTAPSPSVFSFFFTQLEQFGSVLGAFLRPILFQSPVQDRGRWTWRTQAHIQPQDGACRGWAVGGRKVNQIYLGWLHRQLNTWAERQRPFRKSPGRGVTHSPSLQEFKR